MNSSDHCRHQQCRDRGTHANHSYDDCKFKESDANKKVSFKGSDTKHPNLGKAPAKKQRNTKTNASRPEKHASGNTNKGFSVNIPGPRCYICNQPDFFLDAGGQDGSDDESASADTESHHSSESGNNYEQQDQSENSGDDSDPPPSPSDNEAHEWE